jgi:hypothetical protein
MDRQFGWQGAGECQARDCDDPEIAGLWFCLRHVPREDLAEAEAITGWRRCRWGRGRCREIAAPSSAEGYCPRHVAENHQASQRRTKGAFVEEAMEEQLAEVMTEHGQRLASPPAIGDPLEALLKLADQVVELCAIMRDRVSELNMDQWRYAHNRVGEQIRTEVYLYERALDRAGKMLVSIAKLRIAEHKVQLDAEMAAIIERALGLALEASGLDLVAQHKARETLSRELASYTA